MQHGFAACPTCCLTMEAAPPGAPPPKRQAWSCPRRWTPLRFCSARALAAEPISRSPADPADRIGTSKTGLAVELDPTNIVLVRTLNAQFRASVQRIGLRASRRRHSITDILKSPHGPPKHMQGRSEKGDGRGRGWQPSPTRRPGGGPCKGLAAASESLRVKRRLAAPAASARTFCAHSRPSGGSAPRVSRQVDCRPSVQPTRSPPSSRSQACAPTTPSCGRARRGAPAHQDAPCVRTVRARGERRPSYCASGARAACAR